MKKSVLGVSVSLLAVFGAAAQTQEIARVMSAAPVVQQVAVPRQVCTNQQVAVNQPGATTGAGAVIGGVAGGALGNQVGHGSGRAAATVLGVIGGAVLGNAIEGNQAPTSQVQNVQNCTTQTFYENRITGYNVRYDYAGREYQTQMPYDPGPSIQVQVQVTPIMSGGGYSSR